MLKLVLVTGCLVSLVASNYPPQYPGLPPCPAGTVDAWLSWLCRWYRPDNCQATQPCASPESCCTTDCGNRCAVLPQVLPGQPGTSGSGNPGVCPSSYTCSSIQQSYCLYDGECMSTQKCCPGTTCGVCVNV